MTSSSAVADLDQLRRSNLKHLQITITLSCKKWEGDSDPLRDIPLQPLPFDPFRDLCNFSPHQSFSYAVLQAKYSSTYCSPIGILYQIYLKKLMGSALVRLLNAFLLCCSRFMSSSSSTSYTTSQLFEKKQKTLLFLSCVLLFKTPFFSNTSLTPVVDFNGSNGFRSVIPPTYGQHGPRPC